MSKVLVTGGSGFVAGQIIVNLLAQGHEVRVTLRHLARAGEVREMLLQGGASPASAAGVSFVAADLLRDEGWAEAARDRDYVLHVASPLPFGVPNNEDELIVPAREGTLRVLRAARDGGVRRAVVTSSFAAVGYGHAPRAKPIDETDWSNLDDPGVSAYVKSKTLAERAAWDFISREGGGLELAVVNPVAIFGPVLGPDLAASTLVIRGMMQGSIPLAPRVYFGVVDIRDVADLHLEAMTRPEAKGERFLAVSGDAISLLGVADTLRRHLGQAASKAPKRQMPDWLVGLVALFDKRARRILPDLGKVRNSTSAKAERLLGWAPRPPEEAIVATGESLLRLGLLK